jgi:hypothetical protein
VPGFSMPAIAATITPPTVNIVAGGPPGLRWEATRAIATAPDVVTPAGWYRATTSPPAARTFSSSGW